MWQKPAVQRNVAQLRADGLTLIDPESGYLSCGAIGAGRMAEPERIFQIILDKLNEKSG
jgi:phosphopantothenoylcysteine decarboxylase/phosphopantothenate--cysteine ligase